VVLTLQPTRREDLSRVPGPGSERDAIAGERQIVDLERFEGSDIARVLTEGLEARRRLRLAHISRCRRPDEDVAAADVRDAPSVGGDPFDLPGRDELLARHRCCGAGHRRSVVEPPARSDPSGQIDLAACNAARVDDGPDGARKIKDPEISVVEVR
jgi:hypothetical protein